MPHAGEWFKAWFYLGLVCGWGESARPRFDTSTDMGLVLVPADAEIDSVIFRLRATDQDADFPLVFEITATITPVVRIDNLPCTLYNKVCQANVILTKRLIPGRLHDFAVRVRDTKGDSNSMQATISATNATTSRDKIFPHIPSLIMVPEDTKPGKELDYLLVRANSWSGKPVYIELWQPKELFTIRQRQTPTQTRGIITLIGELDFEMQSMYTLTIYATDPYTEPGKDTRNIAGLNIVVIVQDVQDVPPIFTLAPPLTRLNNSVQIGDVILRVHAEDGDKGVPREITYGLVSEGNPFVPFFNISETTGEIVLARSLEELTQITHVGAPVVLTVVAEEIRRSRDEPPAQATVVEVGFLLGEPGNSPPYFENDNYVASIPENLEPGAVIMFPEQYSTRVRDEDIGKAGVFALKLKNNNGTFEINPTVAERTVDFIVTVRDNTFIDYEMYESLSFQIIAQEVGPATNLSASAAVVVFIQDVNDNSPIFDEESYEVTLTENITVGTRVIQVHATDKDTGLFGSIQYTGIIGQGSDAFVIDSDTGLITVAMGSSLDREMAAQLQLTINARDENGKGNTGVAPLIVNLLDVNDNAPLFERNAYEFALNSDLTNFTTPAIIKAIDADAEPPNNEIRYELIHGNYENKFYLNEITGELTLRSPITKFRRKKQSVYDNSLKKSHKGFLPSQHARPDTITKTTMSQDMINSTESVPNETELKLQVGEIKRHRGKRAETDTLYTLTARAYDLGVPHLASETEISVVRGTAMEARIMMFVVQGEHPNLTRTAETLAAITGGRVTVLDTRPYNHTRPENKPGVVGSTVPTEGKRTIVVARVEQTEVGTPLVDVEKIRNTLAANGVGIIGGTGTTNVFMTYSYDITTKLPIDAGIHEGGNSAGTYVNKTIANVHEEVTVYKAENKLLFWLLIILGLLMLLAIAALIICCICPVCPFYMAPRKRRIYSSETLIARTDGRPKRHLHRKPIAAIEITSNGKKQAWSADPTRRNWQFNRRNTKNGGLASLPGDVVYISERPPIDQANVESFRLRDGPVYDPSRRRRIEEQERMYMEDVEERKVRDYDATDADSLQRHEIERGSDILRQAYRQRYDEPESNNEPAVREQHFYREGNAEVLQLVTRGQVEDTSQHRHYPAAFIIDGKDVILQRFIQDQKTRHELSVQESEMMRTVDSHQRPRNLYQHKQEILLLPDELDIRRRRSGELEPNAQKLTMDDEYAAQKMDAESQVREVHRQETSINMPGITSTDRPSIPKEQMQSTSMQSYAFHDLELARQNVLLTRLLMERESRHPGGVMMDAASYLETQSLPGQVAIATQTDRAAATQTERHVRSRSDNDESDEDARSRKKIKSKKRYGDSEAKRTRTLWMKSPIEEEESPCFDKRLNVLRKKVKEVKEGRKICLEPEVLREISDSLDENGSREREGKSARTRQRTTEESSIGYKVLEEKNGSSSPTEIHKQQGEKTSDEKKAESLSSPEISIDNGKYIHATTEKKCMRKESRTKKQKKVESMIKPSFRVLEREITMLTKKLSRLADKKVQQTTGDESTSQEKSMTSKDPKKDSSRGTLKRTEDSKKHKRSETSPDTREAKREKFKYQQSHVMSPGSSEYEDAFEKPKKSKSGFHQEAAKQKQTSSHARVKRQTQVERKERKKQVAQQERESEKCKEVASKESRETESRTEKTAKLLSRKQKLATIGRKERVSEVPSTSTSSDRMNGKKDPFARDYDKKSTESLESQSNHAAQRKLKRKLDHVSEKFSDDFVIEPQMEHIDQQAAIHSMMDTGTHKKDVANGKTDIDIIQFSDDFTVETQTKEMERPMQVAVESETGQNGSYNFDKEHLSLKEAAIVTEIEDSIIHDINKERLTLKEVAEDIEAVQSLKYAQLEETPLDAAEKETYELDFKSIEKKLSEYKIQTYVEELDDTDTKITPLDSPVPKALEEHQTEILPSHNGKRVVEEKIDYASRKREREEMEEPEIEKETLETKEIIQEKDIYELKISDTEKTPREEADEEKHVGSPKAISDALEYTEQREHEKNELYSDTIASKVKEDSTDMKDIIQSLHPSEGDKTVELYKGESDQKEEVKHEFKKHIEEKMLSPESVIDVEQRMTEEIEKKDLLTTIKSLHPSEGDKTVELYKGESDQKEEVKHDFKIHIEEKMLSPESVIDVEQRMTEEIEKKDLLTTIKSDVKEKMTDTKGHEDIIEKLEEISKTRDHKTEKFDSDETEKDVKSTIEALQETSITSPSKSFKDDKLNGIHRALSIDDETLIYIDETSQEASEDDLMQSESIKIIGIGTEDTAKEGADKFEHLDDNLTAKIEVESHETKEESQMPPQEITNLEEATSEKADEDKPFVLLTEITTAPKESLDTEQLRIKHAKEKEESSFEGHEKVAEEMSTIKEKKDDEEVKKVHDEEPSPDQLSEVSSLEKSAMGESDKSDTVAAFTDPAEPQDKTEQQADVSVPIFSSFIDDTLDVTEESDSSSDISRKTTLTMRPYDTPRHRQKWQQRESLEIAGMPGARTSTNGEDTGLETELEEDTDSNLSLDEIENAEVSVEAAISESTGDTGITTPEKIHSDEEKICSVSDLEKVSDEDRKDGDLESKVERIEESQADIKSEIKDLFTKIQDIAPLTLTVRELNGTSKEDINDENIPMTKEDAGYESEIVIPRRKIEKVDEPVKQGDKSEIKFPSNQVEQVEPKEDKTRIGDAEMDKTKTEGSEVDKTKKIKIDKTRGKDDKNGTLSTSEKHIEKTESSPESFMKKRKKFERSKALPPGERKRISVEPEKKITPSHPRRSVKSIDGDSGKPKKDDGSHKQPTRREDERQRKQASSKSKFKTDKRSTAPTKSSEIDTSKTQSKYMAWYDKKREEAEKKRSEKKTTEDEEQLPRWVSRGLKQTAKQKEKQGAVRKTPEITPRSKRKVKPLVNVESEQLKAIVRQGRRLRRAEKGKLEDDPQIQIFAGAPPVPLTETQHRLLQHSEYKYERIPPPFYLHPPPAPHPSPQLSPERSLEVQPCTSSQYEQSENEPCPENVTTFQSGARLRHQQLLEKKSVFDIAYSEAAPSQLRSDSATPPS